MSDATDTSVGSLINDHRREERLLVERALTGDQDALVCIMRQHNQQLYRLAVAILTDKSEAEDVLQEAYIRAFGQLIGYSGEGRLGAWLASIVRNEAIDRLRVRNRRKEHVALEADVPRRYKDGDSPLGRARADELRSDPQIAAERADIRQLLEREISHLPGPFREVFLLREVQELTVEETAEYLGIPAATVKSRDFRARALLKMKVGEQIDASLPQAFTFLGEDCASLVEKVMGRLDSRAAVAEYGSPVRVRLGYRRELLK